MDPRLVLIVVTPFQDHIIIFYQADLVFHAHVYYPPFRMSDNDLFYTCISCCFYHYKCFFRRDMGSSKDYVIVTDQLKYI